MKERDWTRVLGWPGYQVYQKEIDEPGKKLKLWVRRKKAGLKLICSGCGQHVSASRIQEITEREVRDLPCFEYSTTVVCNLETGEPLWFGKTRKKETLDEFFGDELRPRQCKRIEAACVDMWEPFR